MYVFLQLQSHVCFLRPVRRMVGSVVKCLGTLRFPARTYVSGCAPSFKPKPLRILRKVAPRPETRDRLMQHNKDSKYMDRPTCQRLRESFYKVALG
jgi:hypothetical protein